MPGPTTQPQQDAHAERFNARARVCACYPDPMRCLIVCLALLVGCAKQSTDRRDAASTDLSPADGVADAHRAVDLAADISLGTPDAGVDMPDLGPAKPAVWAGHLLFLPSFIGRQAYWRSWAVSGSRWDTLASKVSVLQFFLPNIENAIRSDVPDWSTPQYFSRFVSAISQAKLEVAIEDGFTFRDRLAQIGQQSGEEAAALVIASLKNLFDAGGTVDRYVLDGALRSLLMRWDPQSSRYVRTALSAEQAVDELVDFWLLLSKRMPAIRFYLLVNFPNWKYAGVGPYRVDPAFPSSIDYRALIQRAFVRAQANQIPLEGVVVDSPYEYTAGLIGPNDGEGPLHNNYSTIDWADRVRGLGVDVKALGGRFVVIVNSVAHLYPMTSTSCGTSNESTATVLASAEYKRRTLLYLALLKAKAVLPDGLIVESWHTLCRGRWDAQLGRVVDQGPVIPRWVLPDTEANTLADLAIAVHAQR